MDTVSLPIVNCRFEDGEGGTGDSSEGTRFKKFLEAILPPSQTHPRLYQTFADGYPFSDSLWVSKCRSKGRLTPLCFFDFLSCIRRDVQISP
jgi:hypothetical protein